MSIRLLKKGENRDNTDLSKHELSLQINGQFIGILVLPLIFSFLFGSKWCIAGESCFLDALIFFHRIVSLSLVLILIAGVTP